MANQTAGAQNQQILPDHYANHPGQHSYNLGEGHISVSSFPSVLQPVQLQTTSAPQPSSSSPLSKRKQEDDDQDASARKRRAKVFDIETSEAEARHAGAKHWTDEEKGKLFNWLLESDENWESFSTQMNTVFRNGSLHLFSGEKTFTALKSCYHRNVETFKQIYAFERHLIQVTTPLDSQSGPRPGYVPLPASFVDAVQRHSYIDRRLEAARSQTDSSGQMNVGNLSVKVLDHWCRKGWYVLFKRRFKEDLATGQVAPYFGRDPTPSILGRGTHPSVATLFLHPEAPGSEDADADEEAVAAAVDPEQGVDLDGPSTTHEMIEAEPTHTVEAVAPPPIAPAHGQPTPQPPAHKPRERKRTAAAFANNIARFRVTQPQTPFPTMEAPPPPSQPQAQTHTPLPAAPSFSGMVVPGYSGFAPHGYPPPPNMYPTPVAHIEYNPNFPPAALSQQQAQQLTNLAQNLINVGTTLSDLLRVQIEQGKETLELMRRRDERDRVSETSKKDKQEGFDQKQRAELATQVLGNPSADEEVRKAAKEFLKKLFT